MTATLELVELDVVEEGPVGGTGPDLTDRWTAVSADLEVECGCVLHHHHGPACKRGLTGRVTVPEPGWLVLGRLRRCAVRALLQHIAACERRGELAAPAVELAPVVQMRTLTCAQCERTWERPRQRGRTPKLCPACRAAVPAAA